MGAQAGSGISDLVGGLDRFLFRAEPHPEDVGRGTLREVASGLAGKAVAGKGALMGAMGVLGAPGAGVGKLVEGGLKLIAPKADAAKIPGGKGSVAELIRQMTGGGGIDPMPFSEVAGLAAAALTSGPKGSRGAMSPARASAAMKTGVVPAGWYVHGRRAKVPHPGEAAEPVQFTRDFDVARQYDGGGGIWLARPAEGAKTLDLTSPGGRDMKAVEKKAADQFKSGALPLEIVDDIERSIGRPATEGDVRAAVRETFAPRTIVSFAGAYDNPAWYGWLYEEFAPDFVRVPNGGAVATPGSKRIEYLRVP